MKGTGKLYRTQCLARNSSPSRRPLLRLSGIQKTTRKGRNAGVKAKGAKGIYNNVGESTLIIARTRLLVHIRDDITLLRITPRCNVSSPFILRFALSLICRCSPLLAILPTFFRSPPHAATTPGSGYSDSDRSATAITMMKPTPKSATLSI